MDCLFCKIAEKKIPSRTVFEDDDVMAFEDINPQAPLHVLIIPRKHIATTLDISDSDHELMGKMFRAGNTIAREKGVAERGFRLVMNCNRDSGQTVFHIHMHLLGGRAMHWPPG